MNHTSIEKVEQKLKKLYDKQLHTKILPAIYKMKDKDTFTLLYSIKVTRGKKVWHI